MELIALLIVSLIAGYIMNKVNVKINYTHEHNRLVMIGAGIIPVVNYFMLDGFVLQLLMTGLFITLLEVTFIDLKYMEIPHTHTIMTILFGAGYVFLTGEPKLFIIALINFVAFFVVSIVSGALGGGDVKLAFGLGLFFNIIKLKNFYMYTFGVAFIWAVWMLFVKKQSKDFKIPFAPFMAIGAYLTILL